MSELEGRLREALNAARRIHVADAEPDLPLARDRILQRVRRRDRRMMIAAPVVTAALVVVAVLGSQTLTGPDRSALPVATGAPTPAEEDRNGFPGDCDGYIPFEPEILPAGMPPGAHLGSGGFRDVPLGEQSPPARVHYGSRGRFIDVLVGEPPFVITEPRSVETGVGSAAFGRIHEGYMGTLALGGCTYSLLSYGFTEGATVAFLEGLVPRGESDSAVGLALWPRSTPEEMAQICTSEYANTEPATAVSGFVTDHLQWPGSEMEPSPITFDSEHPTRAYNLHPAGRGAGPGPAEIERDWTLEVTVSELSKDCWAVVNVRTDLVSDEHLSFSKRGSAISAGFRLTDKAEGVVTELSIQAPAGSPLAGSSMTTEEFASAGTISTTKGPVGSVETSFLVILRDREGSAVGAIGFPLPAGDFAAG
jgi:hypothetical protein